MTHRLGKTLVVVAFLLVFAPFFLRGEVVFPYDNGIEVGIAPEGLEDPTQNRNFSDIGLVYLPALAHQLGSDSAGWIATWNPANEMGRPAMHVSGLSKAFPPTWILSWFVRDPLHLYTWLGALAVGLGLLFGYLLLEAHDLHPAACLGGALFLGLGTFPLYWLSFVMFLWSSAWTLGLLYFVRRTCRNPAKRSAGDLVGVAFTSYALLLSGYPQQTVWNGLFVVVYTLSELLRTGDARTRLRSAARLALGVALGLAAAAPVFVDLFAIAAASARTSADLAFFQAVLTVFDGPGETCAYVARLFDAWLWGNPIRSDYPLGFNGLSWSPVVACLLAASFAWTRARRLWPLQVFVLVAVLASLSTTVFGLLWKTGLFSISRFHPLAGAFVPTALLAAFAADAALTAERRQRLAAVGLALALAGVAGVGAASSEAALVPSAVVLSGATTAGTVLFLWLRSPRVLVGLVLACVPLFGARLPLTRAPQDVHLDSPLVEAVRQNTPPGMRFAWVANPKHVLPPNEEVLLGLRSIHTYNSLSSRKYQDWVLRLSAQGTHTLGRDFKSITTPASLVRNPELELAGIGLFLSPAPLSSEVARPLEPSSFFWQPVRFPALEAQVARFERTDAGEATLPLPLSGAGTLAVQRVAEQDDRLRFETTASAAESLLFVSQEHHANWVATADGRTLDTVLVNGFYQGVVVPPNTTAVELTYRGAVHWSWLPQLAFALAGAGLLARRLRTRTLSGSG